MCGLLGEKDEEGKSYLDIGVNVLKIAIVEIGGAINGARGL